MLLVEICVLLGYYAAYSGNSSPTFRDQYTLRNITEGHRSYLFCDESLQSLVVLLVYAISCRENANLQIV